MSVNDEVNIWQAADGAAVNDCLTIWIWQQVAELIQNKSDEDLRCVGWQNLLKGGDDENANSTSASRAKSHIAAGLLWVQVVNNSLDDLVFVLVNQLLALDLSEKY
jgi:hypothetical protein